MGRVFNVTGACNPQFHYMVNIRSRLEEIKKLIDRGAYFTMNRARQYGKTTTLIALQQYLVKDYHTVYLDFQFLSEANFKSEEAFVKAFARELLVASRGAFMPHRSEERLRGIMEDDSRNYDLGALFVIISDWCASSDKPIVMIIDEVDSASNNQVFLDFLSQLRGYYIHRMTRPTFQSVILAGVYDVKNIKRKIRSDEDHKTNSPWNIAADFDVNMSLSKNGIKGMLDEYEKDHLTGMDTKKMATLLYDYTSGYPYLVSRLCLLLDEKIKAGNTSQKERSLWTKEGFMQAVRMLLLENNTLFESLIGKLEDYPDLEKMLKELLFSGKSITYSPTNQVIQLACMFGFVKSEDGNIVLSNRVFDTFLYNYFLSMDELCVGNMYKASLQDKNQFLIDGHLNMRRVLEKFTEHFHDLYGNQGESFVEEEGRKYFLLYLRPIINGTGNYYIESRTRSLERTDIIVDYRGEQFVIEMKIWRRNEYNIRGERQLAGYLEDYHLSTGYLVSFNFNQNKEIGVHEIIVENKILIEAVV